MSKLPARTGAIILRSDSYSLTAHIVNNVWPVTQRTSICTYWRFGTTQKVHRSADSVTNRKTVTCKRTTVTMTTTTITTLPSLQAVSAQYRDHSSDTAIFSLKMGIKGTYSNRNERWCRPRGLQAWWLEQGKRMELSLAYPDHAVKGKKAMLDEWIGFDFFSQQPSKELAGSVAAKTQSTSK